MLILSRREGERIMIGDNIEVVVTRIDHDTVKLGVIAPREMGVFREEVYQRIKQTNLVSVRSVSEQIPSLSIDLRPDSDSSKGT